MTTRGRLVSRLLALLIAVVGSVGLSALPATAGDTHTLQYVALGDSYAAGRGGGTYLDEVCKQTAAAYPVLLDSRKHVHLRANVGCSGATTLTVINTQVSALDDWTTLVTLTVGANDLGVADVAAKCTADPASTACQLAIGNALGMLAPLAGHLSNVYTAVATAAPRALILVTGYPYLFETPTPCTTPTDSIVCQINYATTLLNKTIEDTVETAAQPPSGVNIKYVDVTAAFAGHGIGGSPPLFINDTGPDAYHPNVAGYEAYASAISAALP
jgi:lysophospholipase L1-like esterase